MGAEQSVYEHNTNLLRSLKPGDIVKFHRGAYYHFAIYMGDEIVIHIRGLPENTARDYVRPLFVGSVGSVPQEKVEIAEEDFWTAANNCKGYLANDETKEAFKVDDILRRAKASLGPTEYHLLQKNCEHWVNKIKYDKEESQQATNFTIGMGATGVILGTAAALGGVVGYMLTREPKKSETDGSNGTVENFR
ncbi:unnamed protein product [Lymnaea stagnalis]|uniref:LRAT domain-containing protein n=1 Tax=Lymnaea stagnalis TaxID=6523 RepID=A0AAV2HP11_LYMST